MRIDFTKGSLLACDVSGQLHEHIKVDVVKESELSVAVTFSLLNPGEWVNLQFITDGPLEVPQVHARIAGQSGPVGDVVKAQSKIWSPFILVGIICFLVLPLILHFVFGDAAQDWIGPITLSGIGLILFSGFQLSRTPAWAKRPSHKKWRSKKK